MKDLAKNFEIINDNFIAKNNLLKLNLYILALGYLENRLSYFMEIIKNKNEDKKEQNNELQISYFKKEKKKIKTLQKEKKDI